MISAEIILVLVTVMVEKGIPALISLLAAWKVEDPTLADIDKLHDLVKRPESY